VPDDNILAEIVAKCKEKLCLENKKQLLKSNNNPQWYKQLWDCDVCKKTHNAQDLMPRRCEDHCSYDNCESCYCKEAITNWYKHLVAKVTK